MLRREALRRNSATLFSLQSLSRWWLPALAGLLWAWGGVQGWAQVSDDLVWQQTGGPVGGTITALAVDARFGYWFAGTRKGIYRSTNEGASWEKTGLTDISVSDILVDGEVLYVGTESDGLFRSIDNGASWHPIGTDLPGNSVRLGIDTRGRLIAASSFRHPQTRVVTNRIHRSANDGQTWERLPFPDTVFVDAVRVYPGTGYLLVGTESHGVFRSTDDGKTWRLANTGLPSRRAWGARSLVIDRRTGHVYLGFISERLYRSQDGGLSWESVGFPHDCVFSVVINRAGHLFAGSPEYGVFRSTDGGATWEQANTGLPGIPTDPPYYFDVNALAFTAEGHLLAGTRIGGVHRSTDNGEAWRALNTGLIGRGIYSMAVTPAGHLFAGDWGGRIFRSTDNGQSWTSTQLPTARIDAMAVNAEGHLYVSGFGQPFFRSTDDGQTWEALNSAGMGNDGSGFDDGNALAFGPDGALYAGTDWGLYRSTDQGATWTTILSHRILRISNITGVYALAIGSTGDIFAGSDDGDIFHSTDQGTTWTRSLVLAEHDPILALAVTPAGHVFAGTYDGYIYRSTDNGAAWERVYRSEGKNRVTTLLVGPGGDFLAGTNHLGILRSADGGETWQPANTGLLDDEVNALAVHPETGQLFAGTGGAGVFRSDPPIPVNIGQFADDVPAGVHLLKNYPNPFRTATTIEFTLSEATPVRLAVYDGLGREVAVLVEALMRPGVYRVPFGAKRWPSGLYSYRLETSTRTLSRMMVHVR